MSLSRIPRAFVFFAMWWMLMFVIPDTAWTHFIHHSIPWWVTLVRFAIWLPACGYLPGYERFVGRGGGPRSSDVVPETPTAPLVGWRAWRIGDGTVGLMSLTSPTTWPAEKPFRGGCPVAWSYDGRVPGPECRCGIYVFSAPRDAQMMRLSRRIAVYGPTFTWGRTQVHGTGWRAEYGQPLALVRPRFLTLKVQRLVDRRLDTLGREYGIPVLSLKEAKLLAERMGQAK